MCSNGVYMPHGLLLLFSRSVIIVIAIIVDWTFNLKRKVLINFLIFY